MSGYFVVGHPVAHSLSPQIHEAFAAQFGEGIDYQRFDIEPGCFVEGMGDLRRRAAPDGCNVTAPFKTDAWEYCDELTPRARVARAVNTITFEGSRVMGDNTDGVGFLTDLTQRWKFDPKGARLLILGAGGAVRGLLPVLVAAGFASITVANRTPGRVQDLVTDFGVSPALFTDTWEGGYDLVVNATSAGFADAAPAVPDGAFRDAKLAYDLSYAAHSPFLARARGCGALQAVDGLGMLVEQAAESYYDWYGRRPDTEPVYQKIRALP